MFGTNEELKKLKATKEDILKLAKYCIDVDYDLHSNEAAYRILAKLIIKFYE